MPKPTTIDEYIDAAAPDAQPLLRQLRQTLKEAVPDAKECIKWSEPAFTLDRILYMFTARKNYVSFAPTLSVISHFADTLDGIEYTRCTVKFAYDRPLPEQLVNDMAVQRLCDVLERDAQWM
ncbi:DUF1801 domain-containing protein [Sphingomonas piscis]|uniref:DUF1801 domain-containing protein n=1 Tax=Sphingomonas piscis TaxID=2714943 RepID=A0A6G7YMB3_9SPHN|nr:DUF1801 domain-containing protein [Sphingomonas piscis]QIK77884.1 DUF1801 domain-containing protein [Sphingomonas piscis]